MRTVDFTPDDDVSLFIFSLIRELEITLPRSGCLQNASLPFLGSWDGLDDDPNFSVGILRSGRIVHM